MELVRILNLLEKEEGNQTSIQTIFSVWNTMVGSSLLALPWAFSSSGLILGTIICLITFLIGYHTCALIVKCGKYDKDFSDTVYKYFGVWGWRISMLFSILLMFAAIVIYYEYMTQQLYPVIAAIY